MRVEQANTAYNNYRIPALIKLENGRLLAAYECRNSVSDWAVIDIKIVRSDDDGKTWQTVLLISGEGEHTMNNPVLIVEGNTVHFLYCRNYRQLFYRKSIDGGETFSQAVNVPVELKNGETYTVLAVGPGHGIAHKDALITPIWFANNPLDVKAHHPSFIATLYSLDHGNTWAVGEQIGKNLFINPSECAVAATGEDKVLLSIRNENGEKRRGLAVSETGYSDWGNVHFASNLPDPICQGSMTSANGVIYHVNCASTQGRKNLTLKISNDGFQTSKNILVDEVGEYSDIAVQGNVAYILYERDAINDGIYFKKIQL